MGSTLLPLRFVTGTDGGKYCVAIMDRAKHFLDVAERLTALSRRQQQVATLVGAGLSNKNIAGKMGVSEGTVKTHLHAIYDKLRVQSRVEIIIASRIVQTRSPSD
jgi:DNA-binding NarL/FixJ family response regulator